MPNYRCCVAGCDNDTRYPDRYVIKIHVEHLKFHYFPKEEIKRKLWEKAVSKGLVGFVVTNNKVVCSNHFEFGKPTYISNTPTLYLSVRSHSPKKRRKIVYHEIPRGKKGGSGNEHVETHTDQSIQCEIPLKCAIEFSFLTRNADVNFYTGFEDAETFSLAFDFFKEKAFDMHYWKGINNTSKSLASPREKNNLTLRKLSLEQEMLLTMMRLRLGLLIDDLAFRFNISNALTSTIFTTWIKLMSREMSWLIEWPVRSIIRRNLPTMFRRYYPKCCIIIDCSELFIETPSSLDVAAMCWSNYKHHSTIKYLVGITPNGAISYLSKCYGGRASDIFIVNDCGFLNKLQPGDQVMADRGFKIHDVLSFYQCSLAIPPSKHTNLQMRTKDIHITSKIANVRIYVEQAIKRMKDYRILSCEMQIITFPIIDDIVTVCAALTNLLPPLCKD